MQVIQMYYVLFVEDMERAVNFYKDVIGLSLSFESESWSELAHEGVLLALHGGGEGGQSQTGLVFRVADLALACAEVEAGGGSVTSSPADRPDEGIALAAAADTEGNAFSLMQTED